PLVGFLSECGRAGRSRPPAADVPPGAMASSSAVESAVPTHAIPGLLQKSGKVGNLADFFGVSAEQKWEMVFRVSHFASPGHGGLLRNFPLSHFFLGGAGLGIEIPLERLNEIGQPPSPVTGSPRFVVNQSLSRWSKRFDDSCEAGCGQRFSGARHFRPWPILHRDKP